jgi:hypothetical protein
MPLKEEPPIANLDEDKAPLSPHAFDVCDKGQLRKNDEMSKNIKPMINVV